jgi:transcriptional regulator with XRE-family HTH domain
MHTYDLTAIDPALAYALRRLRRDSGITQEDVAFVAGLTVASIARIERGATNPRWTTVRRIICALDVGLPELVTMVEDDPSVSSAPAFQDANGGMSCCWPSKGLTLDSDSF